MIEYFGYLGAFCIGLIMGLTGAGGSILTVPILVYLMGLNPILATGYSLFIVGATSAFGTIQNFTKGNVEVKTAFTYAIPSIIAIFLTRKFLVPNIPDTVFESGAIYISKGSFLMLLFSIVMIGVAIAMLVRKENTAQHQPNEQHIFVAMLRMFVLGIMIGTVGAGGGFLFVPVLLYIAKLPMKKAIGTSLLIIALNSLIGFTGEIGNAPINWTFLLGFTGVSVFGIVIGLWASKFINETQLKKAFAWFVIAMAVFVLLREFMRL